MQITSSILQSAQDVGMEGAKITRLIHDSNLPYIRITKFINNLTGNGLINRIETKGKRTFVITEKGIMYLEKYKKFSQISESFGLEL